MRIKKKKKILIKKIKKGKKTKKYEDQISVLKRKSINLRRSEDGFFFL